MPDASTRELTIVNRLGLHARPAMEFVDTANGFGADIRVCRADAQSPEWVNGKSIMEMMLLAATKGTVLVVEASGDDADAALDALESLVASGFNED